MRITQIGYRNQRTNLLSDQIGTDIGVELSLGDLGPYVTRSARFPEPAVIGPVADERPNRFDLPNLEQFGRTNLDRHLLEAEALQAGLNTVRYDPLHFTATRPGHSGQIGFAWTAGIQTAKVSMTMTSSKQLTRALLCRAGTAVPEGRRFGGASAPMPLPTRTGLAGRWWSSHRPVPTEWASPPTSAP